ncbi:hypothetical protein [Runella sp.]|uniref:hypothetical protein n=1 Tax=Runella sp. TaxID=1960881 RepID=UPI003D142761
MGRCGNEGVCFQILPLPQHLSGTTNGRQRSVVDDINRKIFAGHDRDGHLGRTCRTGRRAGGDIRSRLGRQGRYYGPGAGVLIPTDLSGTARGNQGGTAVAVVADQRGRSIGRKRTIGVGNDGNRDKRRRGLVGGRLTGGPIGRRLGRTDGVSILEK